MPADVLGAVSQPWPAAESSRNMNTRELRSSPTHPSLPPRRSSFPRAKWRCRVPSFPNPRARIFFVPRLQHVFPVVKELFTGLECLSLCPSIAVRCRQRSLVADHCLMRTFSLYRFMYPSSKLQCTRISVRRAEMIMQAVYKYRSLAIHTQ